MHNILTSLLTISGWTCVVSTGILALFYLILRMRGAHLFIKSKFGPVLIFDSQDKQKTPIRLLNVGNKFQSVCYLQKELRYKLVCIYHQYMMQVVELAHKESGKTLVIGAGGYSLPKWMWAHYPNMQVSVVEIDPVITKLAKRFFFLQQTLDTFCKNSYQELNYPACLEEQQRPSICRARIIHTDGVHYLQHTQETYDVIINDAFAGKNALISLANQEGARLLKSRLRADGVYLANIISPFDMSSGSILHKVIASMQTQFAYMYLIPEDEEDPRVVANNVLVASNVALKIAKSYRVESLLSC